ncbi:hypothetical protein [Aeromonas veronii]|uniref:hypothetical protein n=1 Tax=Aeromonas veronii TaxID=654 RepID=UPI002443761F|nr:hypothetical protein [Aeromonas veronii]
MCWPANWQEGGMGLEQAKAQARKLALVQAHYMGGPRLLHPNRGTSQSRAA